MALTVVYFINLLLWLYNNNNNLLYLVSRLFNRQEEKNKHSRHAQSDNTQSLKEKVNMAEKRIRTVLHVEIIDSCQIPHSDWYQHFTR